MLSIIYIVALFTENYPSIMLSRPLKIDHDHSAYSEAEGKLNKTSHLIKHLINLIKHLSDADAS